MHCYYLTLSKELDPEHSLKVDLIFLPTGNLKLI